MEAILKLFLLFVVGMLVLVGINYCQPKIFQRTGTPSYIEGKPGGAHGFGYIEIAFSGGSPDDTLLKALTLEGEGIHPTANTSVKQYPLGETRIVFNVTPPRTLCTILVEPDDITSLTLNITSLPPVCECQVHDPDSLRCIPYKHAN